MAEVLSTAIAALAGGFLGTYFTRQAQHHKWLLERRAEAFGKLLHVMDDGYRQAVDLLHESNFKGPELELKLLDAYRPMFNQVRIARLYLPRTVRHEVSQLTHEYWVVHSQTSRGSSRIATMDEKLDRIQAIFEEELSPHFWLRPIFRLGARIVRYRRN